MAKNEETLDAVQMMRSIRDRISKEINGMTFEQQQAYIRERLGDGCRARFGCSRTETSPEPPPSRELDMNFD